MLQPIDGPVLYGAVSVSTTATELKIGGSPLDERKTVLIQPKGNSIYIGTDSSVTSVNGVELFKNQTLLLEVGDLINVFAIASSGTIDVRIWEMS